MYTLREEPEVLRALDELSKSLVIEIFAGLTPSQSAVKLQGNQDVSLEEIFKDHLLIIREGIVHYSRNDRTLWIYEEGDLLGLEHLAASSSDSGALLTDFAIVCDCYLREELMGSIAQDATRLEGWSRFLSVQSQMLCLLVDSLQKEETHFSPKVMSFEPGDVIIQQGSSGNEVFTMTEGLADVFVDDVKVGEISGDEIFGAIAAFTTTERTASVIAREPSIVLSLSRDNFAGLIQSRPGTVKKLVDDMAGRIVALNQKVVALSDPHSE